MVGFLKILYVNHSKYNTILYLKVDCKKNYIYIFGLNPGPNNFHQLLYLQLHTNSFMGTLFLKGFELNLKLCHYNSFPWPRGQSQVN